MGSSRAVSVGWYCTHEAGRGASGAAQRSQRIMGIVTAAPLTLADMFVAEPARRVGARERSAPSDAEAASFCSLWAASRH